MMLDDVGFNLFVFFLCGSLHQQARPCCGCPVQIYSWLHSWLHMLLYSLQFWFKLSSASGKMIMEDPVRMCFWQPTSPAQIYS